MWALVAANAGAQEGQGDGAWPPARLFYAQLGITFF